MKSAVTQVDRVTQTNASTAEQTAAAAALLNAQSMALHDAILSLRQGRYEQVASIRNLDMDLRSEHSASETPRQPENVLL